MSGCRSQPQRAFVPHFDAAKASIGVVETEKKRYAKEQPESLEAQIDRLITVAKENASFAFDVRLVLALSRAAGGPITDQTKLQIAREFLLNSTATAAEILSAKAEIDAFVSLARTPVPRKESSGNDASEPFFLVYLEHISLRDDWQFSMVQSGFQQDGLQSAEGLAAQYATKKQQLAPMRALETYRTQVRAQFTALKAAQDEIAAADARFALDTLEHLTKALMLMEDRATAAALANQIGTLTSGLAAKIQPKVDEVIAKIAPVLGPSALAADSATP
jgi:hypothetical protein